MLVNTVYDLQNMNNNKAGTYALGRDIDAGITSTWNGGNGFPPIGAGNMPSPETWTARATRFPASSSIGLRTKTSG